MSVRPPRHRAGIPRIVPRRPSRQARGYDARHDAWRRAVLTEHPWCKDPRRRHPDALLPATHADHIVPIAQGGTWLLENGQGLCHDCHSAKTVGEDGGLGNPIKRRTR